MQDSDVRFSYDCLEQVMPDSDKPMAKTRFTSSCSSNLFDSADSEVQGLSSKDDLVCFHVLSNFMKYLNLKYILLKKCKNTWWMGRSLISVKS